MDDICQDTYVANETNGGDSLRKYCHVLFTVLIPREHNESSFVSFLGGDWVCSHIDDFSPEYDCCPVSLALSNTPLSLLFHDPEIVNASQSSRKRTFNHSQLLYKNIAEALSILNPDSKFAERSHEVNNALYRLLMVHPPMNYGKQ